MYNEYFYLAKTLVIVLIENILSIKYGRAKLKAPSFPHLANIPTQKYFHLDPIAELLLIIIFGKKDFVL